MMNKKFLVIFLSINLLLVSLVCADEKIIQKEEMSFDLCKKVINISAEKLTIAPEISNPKETKRVATFKLVDGILIITCDGEQGLMVVSTTN